MATRGLPEAADRRLTYDGTRTPAKTGLFLLVCLAWLLPGLTGHDPWKGEDAIVFAVASEILSTGHWVVLRVAGEVWVERPPLAFWAAALFGKAFGGLLPLHDAMRLTAGVFTAATLAGVAFTARALLGERAMHLSVLLLIGCLGLLIRAHEMSPDLAALPGIALALYGLAVAERTPTRGGVAVGAGLGIAFLGDGLMPAALVAALLAALPLSGRRWRTRAYAKTAGVALAVAAPLVALWPLLLASVSPALLHVWSTHAMTSRWSDPSRNALADLVYFARILPWYAWPAWPLAAWSLWRARRSLAERADLVLPFVALLVFFVMLSAAGEPRELNAMPLLLPLAILGVSGIDSLRRGAASALDWFGVTTFFLMAALIWVAWIAAATGSPDGVATWLRQEAPGYRFEFRFLPFAFALLLTLIWIAVVARSLRTTRRAVVNWTAGITMVWMLAMMLGLPVIDRARSYRSVSQQLMQVLPVGYLCAVGVNLGDPQRALLYHYAGLRFYGPTDPREIKCGIKVVQASPARPPRPEPGWTEIWRGSRPGDRYEMFVIYQRDSRPASS
jgi:4-amino-4-deoxy-L-arabinose transferase-like glycosyltransferase